MLSFSSVSFIPSLSRASYFQSLDDAAVNQMLLNDFLDVFLINVAVPDFFRVNDDDRTLVAAIHATRLVDADPATAFELQLADAVLGVGLSRCGTQIVAAALAVATLVATEKYVVFVVTHAEVRLVVGCACCDNRF
jgi:hypothetical protein